MQTVPPNYVNLPLIDSLIVAINSSDFFLVESQFNAFINQVKNVGTYDISTWQFLFTEKVYELGTVIAKKYPKLLELLEDAIEQAKETEREILFFIKSGIIINYHGYSNSQCVELIEDLNEKYPNNLEFLQNLANLEKYRGNQLVEIKYRHQVLYLNPNNDNFFRNCFGGEIEYIEKLIEQDKFDEAKLFIENIFVQKTYDREPHFKNWLISILSRIKDRKLIRDELIKKQDQIELLMQKRFESERFKAIELIGFFTAIIAFIFSTISFSKDFYFNETLVLEITFGLILILFLVVLSIIFQPKEKVFKDIRFYSISLILVLLAIIYYLNRNS